MMRDGECDMSTRGHNPSQCDLNYWFFSVTVIVRVNKKYLSFSYSYRYEDFLVTVDHDGINWMFPLQVFQLQLHLQLKDSIFFS